MRRLRTGASSAPTIAIEDPDIAVNRPPVQQGRWATGPGEIVLYKIKYDIGLMTPLMGPIMGGADGKVTLRASIAVRNEPYPESAGGSGSGGGT